MSGRRVNPFLSMTDDAAHDLTGPTSVRRRVLAIAFAASLLLYLDRFCWTFAQRLIKDDLGLTRDQVGYCHSAFFLSYALLQVPTGWLADRFGTRRMLALYVVSWSLFTAAMGWTAGFLSLFLVRILLGIAQAGAYPTCARIVRTWFPLSTRATASGIVALGGRIGGAIAPILTTLLVLTFIPPDVSPLLKPADVPDVAAISAELTKAASASSPPTDGAEKVVARQTALSLIAPHVSPTNNKASTTGAPPSDVVAGLNNFLTSAPPATGLDALDALPWEREGRLLLERAEAGESLAPAEQQRMNRFLLEAVFPDGIRKLYLAGWRPVMWTYGLVGIFAGIAVWWITRDDPREHPRVNQAELRLIAEGREPLTPSAAPALQPLPLRVYLQNRSLWLLSIAMFGTNVGWVFLLTWMPDFLEQVYQLPYVQRGVVSSVPLWIGWLGTFSGGVATDRLTRRLGLRWGRAAPFGVSRFIAAFAFVVLSFEPSLIPAVAMLAVVAFATDFGNAPNWAFNQDVGGRHVASVLGWSNMWGNLGAAASPILLDSLVRDGGRDWTWAFLASAASFLIAGACGILIRAEKPIDEAA